MKPAKLNPFDALQWLEEKEIEYAAHHGNGYNKSLRYALNGDWRVYDRNKLIYYSSDLMQACETYDNIPRSFDHLTKQ